MSENIFPLKVFDFGVSLSSINEILKTRPKTKKAILESECYLGYLEVYTVTTSGIIFLVTLSGM